MNKSVRSHPNSHHELFSYTSGRYLYNEELRLVERYVEFDIEALEKTVERCVGRGTVANFNKLAEGGFNRVFLLTMDDGFEVIAKISYSIVVPKKLTTESEVATMNFLRSKRIPIPRVYTWSSKADNDVGTEYIIMDKAAGKPLGERWFSLTPKERAHLVTTYVNIECKLFSLNFSSYGSLYYKANLPQHLQADLYPPGALDEGGDADRFCIGPSVDYMFWRGKREGFKLNRGPC